MTAITGILSKTWRAVRRGDRAAGPAGRQRRSIWDRLPTPVAVALFLAVAVGVWQLSVEANWISEFVLPPPTAIAEELWSIGQEFAQGGRVWNDLFLTTQEVVLGFVIAGIVGVGLGIAVAKTPFGRKVLSPILVALYAAPKIAFAPVLVVWFGFGIGPKFIMGALIAFFPVVVDTAAGLASTDPTERRLLQVLRAKPAQVFLKLELPTALPFIFAGLKTASVLAVIGAVVGEFLGGGNGLGARILTASSQLALARLFAFVILLSLLAIALYAFIGLLERRVIFWRETRAVPLEP